MAESEGAFEFCVHETLKDLSQNGEHIDLSTFLCFTCVYEGHFMLCYHYY